MLLPAALAIGVVTARALAARRYERAVRERLPLGADGIVAGAEPIDLPGSGGRAALLLHGFGDTPQTLSYLAAGLNARGWSVRVPLLPGHGRTLRQFDASTGEEWIEAARAEYAGLRARYGARNVVVAGLSMGGALATIVAAEAGAELPALALLAPYLSMPLTLRRVARAAGAFTALVPYFAGSGTRAIHDPEERGRSRAYGVTTPRLVRELYGVVRHARRALPGVGAPTLVVHSRTDYRIPCEAAEAAFALLGAPRKQLVWLEGCGHIVTVDYGRDRVLDLVAGWLDDAVPAAGRTPNAGLAPA